MLVKLKEDGLNSFHYKNFQIAKGEIKEIPEEIYRGNEKYFDIVEKEHRKLTKPKAKRAGE